MDIYLTEIFPDSFPMYILRGNICLPYTLQLERLLQLRDFSHHNNCLPDISSQPKTPSRWILAKGILTLSVISSFVHISP